MARAPLDRGNGARLSRRRLDLLPELLTFGGTWAGLTWLGIRITQNCPALATKLDVWFGADLIRHLNWVVGEPGWVGAARHPLSFVLHHVWGALLRAVGFHDPSLVLAAAPLTLAASATVALLPRVFRVPRWFGVASALAIGPLLLTAALPESHLWGGLSMLWCLACLARAHERDADRTRVSWMAAYSGLLAVGFTITNVVPVLILLAALPRESRRGPLTLACAGGLAAALLFALSLAIKSRGPESTGLSGELAVEVRQFAWPSAWAAAKSPRELVLSQFGLVRPWLRPFWGSGPGEPAYRLLPIDRVDPLAVAAAVAWCGVAAIRARRGRPADRASGVGSLLALASLIALHAVHDPAEAYLFAPHAWPFVLVPGLLAFRGTSNLLARALLVLAIAISGVLVVQALAELYPLLPFLASA
ncbi:MAG: hypothetical protein U0527_10840 [Candidatus Eisenbacteria bacterium]